MLDLCQYAGEGILTKHIMDNSCGDGAFLCAIVVRYCEAFLLQSPDKTGLQAHLETYIHGIEQEQTAYDNCLYNLRRVAAKYGIDGARWDIRHADTLGIDNYDGRMDFVVGNPPYVRVHNLQGQYDKAKRFHFAKGGMTDLYLVFFEIGFRMLNASGRLCYITPSSWLNSAAAGNMRAYLLAHRGLSALVDLGHFQAFAGATTYTLITLFDRCHNADSFSYYIYDAALLQPQRVEQVALREIAIGERFYITSRDNLRLLRSVYTTPTHPWCVVKNGFATLADDVFIGELPFAEYTISVLKASNGKWSRAFFPYDRQGKPIAKDVLFRSEKVAHYMLAHREALLKGKTEKAFPEWYLYGRTQALKDVYREKIAINTIIKDIPSIRLTPLSAGQGVYSGLYILTNVPFETIEMLIKSDDFLSYVASLKYYKSGGYYTFTSKDVEKYINYNIETYADKTHFLPLDESGVSERTLTLF